MAKQEKEQVVTELETTKRSIFMMDPAQLLIVGVDFGGPGDVGYDERILLPEAWDEQLVESIIQDGVQQVVKARKDGERYVVVDGRRRVMHARAANLRMQAANPGIKADDLIRVKTEIVRGDEISLFGIQELANAYRVSDPEIVQARKIQAMLNKGMDEKAIQLKLGISKAVLSDRLKMLQLAPPAVEAVVSGEITTNAALALADIPMAQQVDVLRKTRDEAVAAGVKAGKLSTAAIQSAVRDSKRDNGQASGGAVRKTPKEIRNETYLHILDLAKGVAESPKPLSADGRSANPPAMEAMFKVVRSICRLVHPDQKTFDALVKELVKAHEAEERAAEGDSKPATKATPAQKVAQAAAAASK